MVCKLKNVSISFFLHCLTLKIKAPQAFNTSGTVHQTKQQQIPETQIFNNTNMTTSNLTVLVFFYPVVLKNISSI
jgi:hypothetical protein